MELKNYVITLSNGQGYPVTSKAVNGTELILRLKGSDVIEIMKVNTSKFIVTDHIVEVYETENNVYQTEKSWTLARE
jgi:tRNA pseudouridine-54 N-methylase